MCHPPRGSCSESCSTFPPLLTSMCLSLLLIFLFPSAIPLSQFHHRESSPQGWERLWLRDSRWIYQQLAADSWRKPWCECLNKLGLDVFSEWLARGRCPFHDLSVGETAAPDKSGECGGGKTPPQISRWKDQAGSPGTEEKTSRPALVNKCQGHKPCISAEKILVLTLQHCMGKVSVPFIFYVTLLYSFLWFYSTHFWLDLILEKCSHFERPWFLGSLKTAHNISRL